MKTWSDLDTRERILVAAAAALLFVFIVYAAWTPFAKRAERLERNIADSRELQVWMRDAAAEVARLRSAHGTSSAGTGGQSLLAVVDKTAKGGKLGGSMKRIEPESETAVRVWFEGASFDDLVAWLEQLDKDYAVTARTATIDREDEPGRVSARLVLEGGA